MTTSLSFEDIYHFFRIVGATVIPHRTAGADIIEVWASTLMSGARKGQEVLRVQWQRSSSTLDEMKWDCPDTSSEKNVKRALEQTLKYSPLVAKLLADTLSNEKTPENEKLFLLSFQKSLEQFEPSN